MDRLFIPLAAALACGAAPAYAADTDADTAEPIVVTGEHVAYGVKLTTTATKTPTDIRNIPQALTIVSGAQIADQQLRSVGDLLLFVPGASYGSGEGNRDQVVLRGNSSTADFFVDGVRDDVQYFRDFYNIDRVEVLKGPNAMIFGRGGGGGIVNRVLKKPTFAAAREVTASTDNWGALRFTGDIDQPLSSTVGVRLNGVYEDSDSFRRHTRLKRWGINPTVALLVGPDTRIDLSYEHFHDRRTADRGVPANGDEPLRGHHARLLRRSGHQLRPSRRGCRDPRGRAPVQRRPNSPQSHGLRRLPQVLPERVPEQLQSGDGPSGACRLQQSQQSHEPVQPDRPRLAESPGRHRPDPAVRLRARPREVAQPAQQRDLHQPRLSAGHADPTVDADVTFSPLATDANNRVTADVAAIYVQDQIRPAQWLEIVAGLRFDSFKVDVDDLRAIGGGEFGRTDHLWSPRLGIVAQAEQPSFDLRKLQPVVPAAIGRPVQRPDARLPPG